LSNKIKLSVLGIPRVGFPQVEQRRADKSTYTPTNADKQKRAFLQNMALFSNFLPFAMYNPQKKENSGLKKQVFSNP